MQNRILKTLVVILICLPLCGCTQNKILRYRDDAIEQFKNGNYEEALNIFQSSLDIGRGRIGKVQYDILLYKAECLIRLGRPHEARDIYDVLLKIDKNNKDYKDLYNQINNSLNLVDFKNALDENRIDEAIEIYNKIKELGFDHEKSVLYNRAVLYEKQGKWKEAYNAFIIYQKSYPDDENCKKEMDFIDAQSNEYIEPIVEEKIEEETKKSNKKAK